MHFILKFFESFTHEKNGWFFFRTMESPEALITPEKAEIIVLLFKKRSNLRAVTQPAPKLNYLKVSKEPRKEA